MRVEAAAQPRLVRSLALATDDYSPLYAIVAAAERSGFGRIWTTETPTRDAMVRAASYASVTTAIGVGTGIAYSFARPPLAMAVASADLAKASAGRFTLGLGVGSRGTRSRYYQVSDYGEPAERFTEYVQLIRRIWSVNGELQFQGKYHQITLPHFALPEFPPEIVPDIVGAAVGPRMLRAVAGSCDALALHPLAANDVYLEEVVGPALLAGGRDAGRRTMAWVITSIDNDVARARKRAKQDLAFYLSIPAYGVAMRGTRWARLAEKCASVWRDGSEPPRHLREAVPDDLVDHLTLTGAPNDVAHRMAKLEQRLPDFGVDEVVYKTVGHDMKPGQAAQNCMHIVDAVGAQSSRP